MLSKNSPKTSETSLNGWKNWETWETYNLITAYEDIFLTLFNDLETNKSHVLKALNKSLKRVNQSSDYVDVSLVDFDSIVANLNEGK